jgi:hypothetical protein
MIKVLPPPTEAEEYRNTAEILRDLAAQTRFGKTRNEPFNCADNLDRLAARAEHQSEAPVHVFRPIRAFEPDADAASPTGRTPALPSETPGR